MLVQLELVKNSLLFFAKDEEGDFSELENDWFTRDETLVEDAEGVETARARFVDKHGGKIDIDDSEFFSIDVNDEELKEAA